MHVTIEARHDKTNKVAVHPAKTQISLGIRPVWSESSLCAQWAWGSTIKVSIELPVATRHRHDMTEKLLKATLNPNTHTHTHTQKKKSVQHVFKMLEYSLNSIFYGSMVSCRLAYRLLICLHFILLCFSTLSLNFRGGMCSLIAALPCDLFVVMKQSPITYFYLWTK